MKKILIANNNMHIGGIQKSLANLIPEIAQKYHVSLFLFAPVGELIDEVPDNVRVIYANPFTRVLGLSHAEAKKKGIFTLLWRGLLVVLTRLFKTRIVFNLMSRLQNIEGEYDVAISYMQNGEERYFYGGCAELVLNSARAKKKVCFIHCDFENYEGRCEYNIKTLMKFDSIAAVSDSVAKGLINAAPMLRDKVVTVHNCHNYEQIISLSKAYSAPHTDGKLNIFSASRLRREKGIMRMIPILGKIKDVDFVWRIAGDGEDRESIEKLINEYHLEESIILLGNLTNPYPYFSAADVLLVPSYDEAAPMVFGEARILGTPIITTNTASAYELVQEPNIGRVISNDDDRLFYDLEKLLHEFHKQSFDTKTFTDNSTALYEFDKLIDGEET